jgi:protein TonB
VKEVKVIDKPLPPPPKKVEKVQQVKAETPKK